MLVAAAAALAVTERFAAKLTGAKEVPPVNTTAEGNARFAKASNTKMANTLRASNINKVSGAHIHLAPRGEDGPIVVNLDVPDSCTVIRQMRAGNTYVNVHTTDLPEGEIRGQIRAVSAS